MRVPLPNRMTSVCSPPSFEVLMNSVSWGARFLGVHLLRVTVSGMGLSTSGSGSWNHVPVCGREAAGEEKKHDHAPGGLSRRGCLSRTRIPESTLHAARHG